MSMYRYHLVASFDKDLHALTSEIIQENTLHYTVIWLFRPDCKDKSTREQTSSAEDSKDPLRGSRRGSCYLVSIQAGPVRRPLTRS